MTYLIAALQTVDEKIGKSALSILQTSLQLPIEAVLTSLINDITAISHNLALILDDYHVINSQPVHSALIFLLDHLPPQMNLIITTRADPPFHQQMQGCSNL